MTDTSEYEKLALETQAFRDIELELVKESLLSWAESPGSPYTAVEVRDGKLLAGFGVILKAANTEFTWDVSALCVNPDYRDKGVGAKLIQLLEAAILDVETQAILRFETSTRKTRAMGSTLLPSSGYSLIGHIGDFYEKDDDYFMYARHLSRPRPESRVKSPGDPSSRGEGAGHDDSGH